MKRRNIILIALVLTMTMITGCGGFKEKREKLAMKIKSIRVLSELSEVTENMSRQNNYQMKIKINMADVRQDKTYIELTTNVDMKNENEGEIELTIYYDAINPRLASRGYTIIDKDTVTTYTYDSDFEEEWEKSTMTFEEYQEDNLSMDFSGDTEITYEGKEEIADGTECNVFLLKVKDISFITSILGEEFMDKINLTEEDIEKYSSDIIFKIYVDTDKKLIRRMYINLSRVMLNLIDKSYYDILTFDIDIELSEFGEVKVNIPLSEIEATLEKPVKLDPMETYYNPDMTDEERNTKEFFDFGRIYKKLTYEKTFIPLSFKVTDSVAHPTKPVIYLVSTEDKALYEVNYTDNTVRSVAFTLQPERLAYHNEMLYVTLLKGNTDSKKGAIAIVDASTMSIEKSFDINMDPYDILVDKDGFIYVSGRSEQAANLISYTKDGVIVAVALIQEQTSIEYNEQLNKIYHLSVSSMPRELYVVKCRDGKFIDSYDSQYYGDHPLTKRFRISQDGKYIFNGAGTVYLCSLSKDEDIKYIKGLKYAFDDIAFDSNVFYASYGCQLLKYDYQTRDVLGVFRTSGFISYLYCINDNIVAVGKDTSGNYYVEVIN